MCGVAGLFDLSGHREYDRGLLLAMNTGAFTGGVGPVLFMGKAKGMAREFSRAMNDAADTAGVNEISKGLKAASNPVSSAMDGVKSAASDLGKFDPDSETGKLAAEKAQRSEDAKKIHAATARAAADRKLKEAQEAQARAEKLEAEVNPPEKSDT